MIILKCKDSERFGPGAPFSQLETDIGRGGQGMFEHWLVLVRKDRRLREFEYRREKDRGIFRAPIFDPESCRLSFQNKTFTVKTLGAFLVS